VGGKLVVSFSPPAALRNVPGTKHGFTFYETDDVRRLLEDAGFGAIEMIPGSGPRGAFICAIATKESAGAAQFGERSEP
jgi:hypothetical protein